MASMILRSNDVRHNLELDGLTLTVGSENWQIDPDDVYELAEHLSRYLEQNMAEELANQLERDHGVMAEGAHKEIAALEKTLDELS